MIQGGDPDNPLGQFALKLGIPSYIIHGTDQRRSFGIGMRVSHGCIRLYPEDIERLYAMVPVGTAVRIIDQPIKAGFRGEELLLEVHQPLLEDGNHQIKGPTRENILQELRPFIQEGVDIDPDKVAAAWLRGDGVPLVVSREGFQENNFWSDPYF